MRAIIHPLTTQKGVKMHARYFPTYVFFMGLLCSPTLYAQDSAPEKLPSINPSPTPTPTPAPKNVWRVRLFNGDDIQYVICNGKRHGAEANFNQTVEIDLNSCLIPGQRNDLEIVIYNTGGGYTWGYSILKNGAVAITESGNRAERYCGEAGTIGCDNNAQAPSGIVRRWKYYFLN